jgi:hypothetical protein
MKGTLYLKKNSTGLFYKARYIKSRKAYRLTWFSPGGEVTSSTKHSWAYTPESTFEERLKLFRILKNKPTKAQIQKMGWFGKNPPEWVKQTA